MVGIARWGGGRVTVSIPTWESESWSALGVGVLSNGRHCEVWGQSERQHCGVGGA
jgi:hypothetical protein